MSTLQPASAGGLSNTVTFGDNPEPRCACILLLDTSGSMANEKIQLLNEGVAELEKALKSDPLASLRVEPLVITFGGAVQVHGSFATADQFTPPVCAADGVTPLAEGIICALDAINVRVKDYQRSGLAQFRPWIVMITDGEATDAQPVIDEAKRRLHAAEAAKQVCFFAVATEDANHQKLQELSVRPVKVLKGLAFKELFTWVSLSLISASSGSPGQAMELPPTPWALSQT